MGLLFKRKVGRGCCCDNNNRRNLPSTLINCYIKYMKTRGFTLIEMLVVLMIMATIATLGFYSLQGAKFSARDATRKSDLQDIRSALELYRADCGTYPPSLTFTGVNQLTGSGGTCSGNVYMEDVPQDPLNASDSFQYEYYYDSATKKYYLCSYLEHPPGSSGTCGAQATKKCSSATGAANSCYLTVVNP